ncbi:MAG TPA: hypothetical protein VM841_09070 [Actinomycetota bacterium]|nr:hypothetical protein [Actinomycetota bacterium]
MNRSAAILRPAILGAGALAGLVGAHAINYWLVASDPIRREALLHATGHSWLPGVESFAVAAALASVAGALAFGWREAPSGRVRGFRATTGRLALAQAAGFAALEIGERFFAGVPLHHLSPLLLALGIGLQVLVACGIAATLGLLARAGARIAQALRPRLARPSQAPRALPRPVRGIAFRHLILTAADPVRGPPAAAP